MLAIGIPLRGLFAPVRRTSRTRRSESDHPRLDQDPLRAAFSSPKRSGTYWDILKRRARENRIDFIEGVATALTPIAFFETVMVKSYENLVDSDTKVDVNTGIVAAGRLQSLIDSRDYSHDLLVMKVQMDQICDGGQVHSAAGDVGRDHREAGGAGTASGGARRRHGLLR